MPSTITAAVRGAVTLRRSVVAGGLLAAPALLGAAGRATEVGAAPVGQGAGPVEPRAGGWGTWVLESGAELRPPPPPAGAAARGRAPPSCGPSWRSATRRRRSGSPTGTPGRPATAGTSWPRRGRSRRPRWRGATAPWPCSTWPSATPPWPPGTPSTPTTGPGRAWPIPPSIPRCPSRRARPTRRSTRPLPAPRRRCWGTCFRTGRPSSRPWPARRRRSRVLAGLHYPSDVRAGLELGQAVAARVIERARGDGSDARVDGRRAGGPRAVAGDAGRAGDGDLAHLVPGQPAPRCARDRPRPPTRNSGQPSWPRCGR